ncbi:unnamed protein product [Penicillium discolor]
MTVPNNYHITFTPIATPHQTTKTKKTSDGQPRPKPNPDIKARFKDAIRKLSASDLACAPDDYETYGQIMQEQISKVNKKLDNEQMERRNNITHRPTWDFSMPNPIAS